MEYDGLSRESVTRPASFDHQRERMDEMRFAFLFLITALTSLVISCADDTGATSPAGTEALSPAAASVFHDNVRIPVDIEVFIPCAAGGAGEFVVLTGNLHVLFHETVNGNRFNVKFHTQPQGISGLGETTGDKYQGTGVTQERFGGSFVNGQFSDTFINNFRIIGQGPGNNLLIHETFHVTFNANGELTALVDNFRAECK